MSSSTTVEISDRAEAVVALRQELDKLEKEQLNLAAQMSGLMTKQIQAARRAGALSQALKKLLVPV